MNNTENDSIVNNTVSGDVQPMTPEMIKTEAKRVAVKDVYKDGEFVTPIVYKCAHCGQTLHVRKMVMFKRIWKQFDGNFKVAMENMVCQRCKRNEKNKEVIEALAEQQKSADGSAE